MSQQHEPVVRTPAGAVRGSREGTGERYRAIPYATTPTGGGRFAETRAHPGWPGVRDGTRPSPSAPQPARNFGRLDMSPYFGPGWIRGEEYLTLDVYTPERTTGGVPSWCSSTAGGS